MLAKSDSVQHRALYNDLILCEIFQYVAAGDYHGRLDRTSLARCAKVCKAFLDPALSVLWQDLPSFLPLLRLLSSSVAAAPRGWPPVPSYQVLFVLSGPIKNEDWSRFRTYAYHVRHLTYDEETIDRSVFAALGRLSDEPLLP